MCVRPAPGGCPFGQEPPGGPFWKGLMSYPDELLAPLMGRGASHVALLSAGVGAGWRSILLPGSPFRLY